MNAVSIDISQFLHDNGFGVINDDLFAMEWREGKDAQTLIIDTSGRDSDQPVTYENPYFQILVRGAKNDDVNASYTVLKAIHDFIIEQDQNTIVINGDDYLGITPIGTLTPLGRDDNDRFVWSMNYFTFRNGT